jgi:serine/threonine protein kinase
MAETTTYHNALQMGSMLLEYRLESVLGAGGFGMTYLGWDTNLEKHVAIKEYLPTDLAVRALDGSVVPITTELKFNYQWGLDRFILEARTLAKFSHPHIVRVNRYFEAHGTGYMVMDYEKGQSLNQILKAGQPDEARLKGILMPLLDGLQAVHATGFLHRDIKPANIFVRESGSPVLIDFGASRQALGGATKSITAVLTPGYAPLEQYASDGNQGPWSDIYAMAGVLYRAFVNDNPPDAVSRLKSDSVPAKLAALRGRVSEPTLRAMEWALTLDEKSRPQSVPEWKRALESGAVTARPSTPSAPAARSAAATLVPTQPVQRSQPVSEPRRSTRPPPEETPKSGWRWVVIFLVVVVAGLALSAWNKQRGARELERKELARAEGERAAEARRDMERSAQERQRAEEELKRLTTAPSEPIVIESRPAAAPEPPPSKPAPVLEAAPAPSIRERPGREREDRPGPLEDKKEMRQQMAEQDFRGADRNGDGYLSADEVRGRFPAIEQDFRRVDADGDGRVSLQEFFQLRRMQAEKKFWKKPPP